MTQYRRNLVAGVCFFFTVNLAERRLSLLTAYIDELRAAFRETRTHHPFTVDAIVVLPDHFHTVWTLPDGDADFATRWRLIKSAFSRRIPGGESISASRAAKGERASGSVATGSTPSATKLISSAMSTISISTQSNMG